MRGIRKFDFVLTCFLVNLTLFVGTLSHFLDIEELKSIHYDIDIREQPVVFGRPLHTEVVYLSSKFGQRYECQIPDVSDVGKVQEEEKSAARMGISDLLRPMENLPCLRKTKDWWTYEFCYGKHVQQFHLENNQKTGETITLGIFESEMDWENKTHSDAKRHRLNRYHSHKYVNGSTCDLTGRPREAEVRFLCAENELDTVSRIDEPESCRYVITVHTLRICHHPYLKPLAHTHPKTILCSPLLTPDQYEQYAHQEMINKYSKEAQDLNDVDTQEEMEGGEDGLPEQRDDDRSKEEEEEEEKKEEGDGVELLEEHRPRDSSPADVGTITVKTGDGDIQIDADVSMMDSDQFADVLTGVLSRVRDTLKHINEEMSSAEENLAGMTEITEEPYNSETESQGDKMKSLDDRSGDGSDEVKEEEKEGIMLAEEEEEEGKDSGGRKWVEGVVDEGGEMEGEKKGGEGDDDLEEGMVMDEGK